MDGGLCELLIHSEVHLNCSQEIYKEDDERGSEESGKVQQTDEAERTRDCDCDCGLAFKVEAHRW
jgi:hypothetical protein